MPLSCGIVGLPNVGKSTLFNALIKAAKAQAANYPFCTIEPNIGTVEVPDERLYEIATLENSAKIVPTFIEFVDIAGLVRGASKGEGLGNQFLSHIRNVDAIVQVVRCFEDDNITHIEGSVNPIRDIEIIDLELVAKDLESVQKAIQKIEKTAKGGNQEAKQELEYLKKFEKILNSMIPLRRADLTEEEKEYAENKLFLLSIKPTMFVANLSEEEIQEPTSNQHYKNLLEYAEKENAPVIPVCAKLESEMIDMSKEEVQEMLNLYGLKETGLSSIIKSGYKLLGLITFFTAGPKESRAWAIAKDTKAQKAAGKIHSDIERGFIAAEVINYDDYIKVKSMTKAKEQGLIRLEGKDYIVKDGDIIYFRFNV